MEVRLREAFAVKASVALSQGVPVLRSRQLPVDPRGKISATTDLTKIRL